MQCLIRQHNCLKAGESEVKLLYRENMICSPGSIPNTEHCWMPSASTALFFLAVVNICLLKARNALKIPTSLRDKLSPVEQLSLCPSQSLQQRECCWYCCRTLEQLWHFEGMSHQISALCAWLCSANRLEGAKQGEELQGMLCSSSCGGYFQLCAGGRLY